MDQRLVFSGLVLDLVVAYSLVPVLLEAAPFDLLTQGKLFLQWAQTLPVLTGASLVLITIGLLQRRGPIPTHRRALVGLSLVSFPGILFSAWWAAFVVLAFDLDCTALTAWKCYEVQAGTYFGYCFFPAIAIPIVTLIWISRIRTRTENLASG